MKSILIVTNPFSGGSLSSIRSIFCSLHYTRLSYIQTTCQKQNKGCIRASRFSFGSGNVRPTRSFRTSKKDVLLIIGDWNAKVGSQETPGVTGKFGLGVWNEAGQKLIEFCHENTLVIANTLFQQHKRRLYTWTSPDGQH